MISGCEHEDQNPIVKQAWFGFDQIVKRTKCYENVTKTGNNTTCKVWSIIWYIHLISISYQWKFKLYDIQSYSKKAIHGNKYNIKYLTTLNTTFLVVVHDYTDKVLSWCNLRKGCLLHSVGNRNNDPSGKKFWQICYTCVNYSEYKKFLLGKNLLITLLRD